MSVDARRPRGVGVVGDAVAVRLCPDTGHAVETTLREVCEILEGGRAEVEVRRRAGNAAVRDRNGYTLASVCAQQLSACNRCAHRWVRTGGSDLLVADRVVVRVSPGVATVVRSWLATAVTSVGRQDTHG